MSYVRIVPLCSFVGAKLPRGAQEVAMAFSLSEWWMRRRIGAACPGRRRSRRAQPDRKPLSCGQHRSRFQGLRGRAPAGRASLPFRLRSDAAAQGLHAGGLPVPLRASQGSPVTARPAHAHAQSACAQNGGSAPKLRPSLERLTEGARPLLVYRILNLRQSACAQDE